MSVQKPSKNIDKQEVARDPLSVAIAFAKLELLELEAGKREPHQCPGIQEIARQAHTLPPCKHITPRGQRLCDSELDCVCQ